MSEPQPMPSMERPALRVRDVPERRRFEAILGDGGETAGGSGPGEGGQLAGIIAYRRGDGWIALVHTEVLPGFEGQGVGSRLVRAVLAELRARNEPVVPRCPFVVAWLQRHPEQHDVLFRPLEAPDPGEPAPA